MNMANCITGIRILCSILLLFCPALSSSFYALYSAAGLTDMIDGTVALKTSTASAFGATLDTVADFIFLAAALIKLIPIIDIPMWIAVWAAVIVLIKAINIASGYVMRKRFMALHTTMNKVAGILLFVLPLTLSFMDLRCSATVVCAAATFAAIQEGHFIRTGREQ